MADEMDDRAIQALKDGTEPAPSMRERRFVSVAWPTTGGLWVAEFDTTLLGLEEEDNLVPADAAGLGWRGQWTKEARFCEIISMQCFIEILGTIRDMRS